jgi:hypothetical protein
MGVLAVIWNLKYLKSEIGTFEKPLPHAARGAKSDTGQQGGF